MRCKAKVSVEVGIKTCSRCLVDKALAEFHRKASARDGHRSVCRACRSRKQPPKPAKYPNAEILWQDYQREHNVHKVGDLYGVVGETIRTQLNRAGYRTHRHHKLKETTWRPDELETLRNWYAEHSTDTGFKLDDLARRLGRLKSNVSRKARALGWTNLKRRKLEQRKPPKPNKYATKEERNRAIGERMKRYISENGHPKGALGMRHTPEAKARIGLIHKNLWADPNSKFNSEEARQRRSDAVLARIKAGTSPFGPTGQNPYSRAKRGMRDDLGRFFRSSWEANYARYLEWLRAHKQIKDWDYECQTFWFEEIKRGTRCYTPDFKVTNLSGNHEWHEVKGWMDPQSVTRLKRMAKYYPNEKLIVIGNEWFKRARKQGLGSLIPNWEK